MKLCHKMNSWERVDMELKGENLAFSYENGKYIFENINIKIQSEERVVLFASSGFGKSTLGKILAGYENADRGRVTIEGEDLVAKGFCPVQLIYQHPEKSVNPKWTIKKILSEGGDFQPDILEKLDIPNDYLERYPFELSGGELQRICIARALKEETRFIIADEITTMLDTITQAKIWKFLLEEVQDRRIGLLVITHNQHLANRIATRVIDFEALEKESRWKR